MRAARFHGPGDIRIEDVPEPEVGPGQVQVSVDWCGICGTDLHEFLEGPIFIPAAGAPHPLTGQTLPVVMGHEFAGVDAVIDPTETDAPSAVRDLTCGGADVAFECAGIDAVLAAAIGSVRPGGTVVNVAIRGHVPRVAVNELVFSEVTLIGSLASCDDHADPIALLRDGKVDAAPFITGRIGLDDLVEGGFRQLIDHKEENVKILVSPKDVLA